MDVIGRVVHRPVAQKQIQILRCCASNTQGSGAKMSLRSLPTHSHDSRAVKASCYRHDALQTVDQTTKSKNETNCIIDIDPSDCQLSNHEINTVKSIYIYRYIYIYTILRIYKYIYIYV